MSVTSGAVPRAARPANTWRSASIGAPTKTTSAIATTVRSVFADDTISRSSALRTTSGLGSLPTRVMSGRAFFNARANEAPIRPMPTTATVGTEG